SQPTWVPVSCRSWRRKSDRSRRAGTRARRAVPLTVSWTSCSSSRSVTGRSSRCCPCRSFRCCPSRVWPSRAVLRYAVPYLGLAEGLQQRPPGQDPGQVSPVVGGGVDVGFGVELL